MRVRREEQRHVENTTDLITILFVSGSPGKSKFLLTFAIRSADASVERCVIPDRYRSMQKWQ